MLKNRLDSPEAAPGNHCGFLAWRRGKSFVNRRRGNCCHGLIACRDVAVHYHPGYCDDQQRGQEQAHE
jgi:hypothetical protein